MKKGIGLIGLVALSLTKLALADGIVPIRPIPPIFLGPKEVPCNTVLKTYFDWASGVTPSPEDNRWVGFTLVFNQNKNAMKDGIDAKDDLAGYTVGPMKVSGGNLTGQMVAFFSDRMFCPSPNGGFCLPTAPFNPGATDKQTITITPDGKMTTVLNSWGNSTFVDNLVCLDNGVLYAPSKLGQNSMSVVTLRKTGFRSPR